jgi:hypothetical protein
LDLRISQFRGLVLVGSQPFISLYVGNGDVRKFERLSKLRRSRISEDLVESFSDERRFGLACCG